MSTNRAKFSIVVKHRHFDFRGVIYDVDFEFNNSKNGISPFLKMLDQERTNPFTIFVESNDVTYEAYVSEQNLLIDRSNEPVKHPLIEEIFVGKKRTSYLKPLIKIYRHKLNIWFKTRPKN